MRTPGAWPLAASISRRATLVSMVELFASSTPYWIIILLCMGAIIAVPAVATALPAMRF